MAFYSGSVWMQQAGRVEVNLFSLIWDVNVSSVDVLIPKSHFIFTDFAYSHYLEFSFVKNEAYSNRQLARR